MNLLKIIKIAVVVLTFTLFFGSTLLIGKVAKRIKDANNPPQEISLNEAEGSQIKQIVSDNGKLYIVVTKSSKPDKIIIYDAIKARKISNININ
jgi:uncharacterized secreted protein with C-terminal beta-propeller domain